MFETIAYRFDTLFDQLIPSTSQLTNGVVDRGDTTAMIGIVRVVVTTPVATWASEEGKHPNRRRFELRRRRVRKFIPTAW